MKNNLSIKLIKGKTLRTRGNYTFSMHDGMLTVYTDEHCPMFVIPLYNIKRVIQEGRR